MIASWNLRNLSKKRDMAPLAGIIKNYDIVAIQEVRNEEAVKIISEMAEMLYFCSEPVCSTKTSAKQTGKRKEMYAFIYKKHIKVLEPPQLVSAEECFVRAPYVGYFKCGEFDFVLGNIHIVWGKKSDRILELQKLPLYFNCLKQRIKKEGDIILCGDFNTKELNVEGWKSIIPNNYDTFLLPPETSEYLESGILDTGKLSDHLLVYAKFATNKDDDEAENIKLEKLII